MWNSVSVAVTTVAPPCAAGLEAAAEVGAAALVGADAVGELADVDEPEEEHPAASRVTVAAAPRALANVRPRRGRFLRRGSRSIGNENTTKSSLSLHQCDGGAPLRWTIVTRNRSSGGSAHGT